MTFRGLVARDENGVPQPNAFRIDPHYGELFIDDGTGFVSGSDPTAEIVDGTPLLVGQLNGVTGVAAAGSASTDGRLNVQRPGDYEVYASGDVALSGAADTFLVEVYKNGAVVASAAASYGGEISAKVVAVGTGAQGWALRGKLRGLVKGDYVDLRVTGTGTTTCTIKQLRFGIQQIGDADPAAEV
ncbi:MAG: hypothetical protein VW547_01965 [Alphaproteobacteria bacterium]